jgi:hypothetical protein
MSFNGKYVPLEAVVARIADLYEDHIDIYDAAEWAGEAMNKIGAKLALEPDIATITITDYKGLLPDGLVNINSIREITVDYEGNEVGYRKLEKSADEFLVVDGDDAIELPSTSYKIVRDYIFIDTIEDGEVQISYMKYPFSQVPISGTDPIEYEDGFPMIPDDERYIEAVACYMRYKLDYKLWRKNLISSQVFQDSEREWLFYVNSANTSLMTPDYDGAEALYRSLTKIVHDRSANQYAFKYLNTPNIPRRH